MQFRISYYARAIQLRQVFFFPGVFVVVSICGPHLLFFFFPLVFSEGTEQEIGGGGGNFQGRVANR